MLHDEIQKIINSAICDSENTRINFLKRLEESSFTRDENPQTHYCVYFLPYDPVNQKVLIVHHKKSGLWLSPGGHIDKGEGLLRALNREIKEELGMRGFFGHLPHPFLLTITPIPDRRKGPCRTHYDIWYLLETSGSSFAVDPKEFHETKWLTIAEAEKIVTDGPNRKALETIKKKYE